MEAKVFTSNGAVQQQLTAHDGSQGGYQPGERKKSKEIIHSGHFMVSDFEAEGRDDYDEVAIPVPESPDMDPGIALVGSSSTTANPAGDLAGASPGELVRPNKKTDTTSPGVSIENMNWIQTKHPSSMTPTFSLEDVSGNNQALDDPAGPLSGVTIDQSLTKLFQCMTLAYSSKLTSPRWKNFKGLRLQWKDKIRLNNLIWRCWHMQFIERRNTAVCQFASPLEVDQHNKPEAVVLEGKYWKRRLATVTAEYKKWRIFFKNQLMGRTSKDLNELGMGGELDQLDWFAAGPRSTGSFNSGTGSLILDDDFFMDFTTDTLFSSLTSNQPFQFPNPREIAKGAGLADFIQPGLIQLQPNLDDFMDTFEPLYELIPSRLPPVEEEIAVVEDHLAGRAAVDQNRRQNDYQMPYSTSSNAGASTSASSSSNLLNYLPMDHTTSGRGGIAAPSSSSSSNSSLSSSSSMSYLPSGSQFVHQAQQSSSQLPPESFSYSTLPSDLNQSANYEVKPQVIQPAPGSFVVLTGTNPFDGPTTPPFLQRQNSTGSDHGFAVPAQFSGKQRTERSRSRSGSGTTTPTNPTIPSSAILPSPAALLSALSQPTRSIRGKAGVSMSSPARLLSTDARSGGSSSRGGASGSAGGRSRANSELQPIMPALPSSSSSPSSGIHHPRPILPHDSGTLLAQLLKSTQHPPSVSSSSASLVLSSEPSSTTRIPLIFPLATNSEAEKPKGNKAVSLIPAAFTPDFVGHHVEGRPPPVQLKRENSSSNSVMAASEEVRSASATPSASGVASTAVRHKSGGGQTAPVEGERTHYKEHRRVSHINAEQKRRCNIKNGFDMLQSLLPGGNLGSSSSSGGSSSASNASGHGKASDVSKAAMLHRGAEYIRVLRTEKQQQQEEMEQLKQTIESLNTAISGCQALLPANGAPVSRQRNNRMKEMFDDWVRTRTLQNWKFWIFSILMQPLLESYSSSLSSSTYEDLWQCVHNWVDHHCSLALFRPMVFNSLRNLSKTTDILTNPSRLPEEAAQAAIHPDGPTAGIASRNGGTS